jgi:ABC-type amino acid transport system permease subunit
LLLALLAELTRGALPAAGRFGFDFITSSTWDPVAGQFGAWPAIFGTLLTSFLALLMAVPLSLGVAIYLTEFAPNAIRQPIATVIELLAAIPSVVYGLWGIFVLIPFLQHWVYPMLEARLGFLPFFTGPIYGPSVLSAALILTIMVVPFIMSVSREVLLAVPSGQREAALALGATRWEAVSTAIVPVCEVRHHRCRDPWAWSITRRDDGGHDAHREPARSRGVALCTRLLDGRCYRERVRRRGRRADPRVRTHLHGVASLQRDGADQCGGAPHDLARLARAW